MDETQKHYVKSDTKENRQYDSTYMKFWNQQVLFPVKISNKDFIYSPARNKNNKNNQDEEYIEQWFARYHIR